MVFCVVGQCVRLTDARVDRGQFRGGLASVQKILDERVAPTEGLIDRNPVGFDRCFFRIPDVRQGNDLPRFDFRKLFF